MAKKIIEQEGIELLLLAIFLILHFLEIFNANVLLIGIISMIIIKWINYFGK